mmetsp:Transcript_18088/g.21660  ORF Transcript_18088/g.21660 Transcript_18088/m.21660 type:complete len:241 (+) Transcript_18088:779-1501(+)
MFIQHLHVSCLSTYSLALLDLRIICILPHGQTELPLIDIDIVRTSSHVEQNDSNCILIDHVCIQHQHLSRFAIRHLYRVAQHDSIHCEIMVPTLTWKQRRWIHHFGPNAHVPVHDCTTSNLCGMHPDQTIHDCIVIIRTRANLNIGRFKTHVDVARFYRARACINVHVSPCSAECLPCFDGHSSAIINSTHPCEDLDITRSTLSRVSRGNPNITSHSVKEIGVTSLEDNRATITIGCIAY